MLCMLDSETCCKLGSWSKWTRPWSWCSHKHLRLWRPKFRTEKKKKKSYALVCIRRPEWMCMWPHQGKEAMIAGWTLQPLHLLEMPDGIHSDLSRGVRGHLQNNQIKTSTHARQFKNRINQNLRSFNSPVSFFLPLQESVPFALKYVSENTHRYFTQGISNNWEEELVLNETCH